MRSAFPLQEDLRWFVEQILGGGGGGELEGRLKVEGGKLGEGGREGVRKAKSFFLVSLTRGFARRAASPLHVHVLPSLLSDVGSLSLRPTPTCSPFHCLLACYFTDYEPRSEGGSRAARHRPV